MKTRAVFGCGELAGEGETMCIVTEGFDGPRKFTLMEANAMLPSLTAVLTDVRRGIERARGLQKELRMIKAVGHDDEGALIMAHDYRMARERFDAVLHDLNEKIDAIERTGCQVKSAELGIVDFPGTLNGRSVLFCWRVGEAEIGHYHLSDEGFAGRRRLKSSDDDTPPRKTD